MALINCPECGNQVSDSVGTVCPKCGFVDKVKVEKEENSLSFGSWLGLTWFGLPLVWLMVGLGLHGDVGVVGNFIHCLVFALVYLFLAPTKTMREVFRIPEENKYSAWLLWSIPFFILAFLVQGFFREMV